MNSSLGEQVWEISVTESEIQAWKEMKQWFTLQQEQNLQIPQEQDQKHV